MRFKKKDLILGALFTLFCLVSTNTFSAVVIGGTRVIYYEENKETQITVEADKSPVPTLVQSWIDEGDSRTKAPFIVTPPLFRMDPGENNSLRIIYNGPDIKDNKEHLFYLNVRSIPATNKHAENSLQIAIKTRMKLFYRPEGVETPPEDFASLMRFSRDGNKLVINNNTVWHAVFYELIIGEKEWTHPVVISPSSYVVIPANVSNGQIVRWQLVNDYGAATKAESVVLN